MARVRPRGLSLHLHPEDTEAGGCRLGSGAGQTQVQGRAPYGRGDPGQATSSPGQPASQPAAAPEKGLVLLMSQAILETR